MNCAEIDICDVNFSNKEESIDKKQIEIEVNEENETVSFGFAKPLVPGNMNLY